jgi:hypothetical protein
MSDAGSLLAMFDPSLVTNELLASLDIAEVNLACASDLSGAEELDFDACLAKIDDWSDKVRHATSRNYFRFLSEPQVFDHSLGKFYMAVLCATLQRECGVRYNPDRANDPGDARDSRDRFIHGITHGAGGTCASLPVLYVAVGRRLGYPLRIVQGARHLFLRWDESDSSSSLARDRFNIEATATGFVSNPDRFYEVWPFPHPDPDIDPRYYLRSLTPREELASFLCIRSIVLMDNGKFAQAIQPAAWARQLAPNDYSIKVHLELTMLLALGILDEKPAWMDEHPLIRPDGAKWSRYWWPRPMEGRELLPAARLPAQVLARILPPDGPDLEIGDLADALYHRAHQYADDVYVTHVHQTAISQQNAAEALYLNELNRARHRAMLDQMLARNPKSNSPMPPSGLLTSSPVTTATTFGLQVRQPTGLTGNTGTPTHLPTSLAGFAHDPVVTSSMPSVSPIQQVNAAHRLRSLATRRPPFALASLPTPAARRIG